MAVMVGMKQETTGDTRFVKVGWSWILFFFGSFFGVPWFMRKLNAMGFIGVIFPVLMLISAAISEDFQLGEDAAVNGLGALAILASWGFNIFGGMQGNKMTIKNYLEKGYKFTSPNESSEMQYMNSKYHIF